MAVTIVEYTSEERPAIWLLLHRPNCRLNPCTAMTRWTADENRQILERWNFQEGAEATAVVESVVEAAMANRLEQAKPGE